MFRKSLISLLIFGAVLVVGRVSVSAQFAPVNGTVELQKADGTREPVAGALIEVFRTDVKGGFPSVKTDKKGSFGIAGMMLGATFVFSISAPGAAPTIHSNVRAGQEKLLITMVPGDGSKFTEEQARKGGSTAAKTGGQSAELTAEQKKAQAAYEAQVKDVTSKNERAQKANEIIARAIKEGNDAFEAKNYDLAIAKYDEGIAADPSFVGSAPTFHINRGIVLTTRAVETYNKTVKLTDATEKMANFGRVRKDLADASDGYLKSWNLLKNAPAGEVGDAKVLETNKLNTLRGAKDTFQKAVRTEQVDPITIESAKVLLPEYLSVETDATKKADADVVLADLYRVAGDSDNAIAAYKSILEKSPDDADALAGAGFSLVNIGYLKEDKAKLQEGADLLQKFASAAPDTHKYKADAVALIDNLKKEQNVTPQKVTTTKKKKN